MEVFSLEDESNELFITQQPKSNEIDGILPDGMDLKLPCSGIVSGALGTHYSDISNFESDVDIPSSQVNGNHR